jgi:hypothetical protein
MRRRSTNGPPPATLRQKRAANGRCQALRHLPGGGSFGCGDANRTCSDRSASLAVDGDGIDLRSRLCVEEPGHLAPAAMLAAPRADRKQHRQKVAAGFR